MGSQAARQMVSANGIFAMKSCLGWMDGLVYLFIFLFIHRALWFGSQPRMFPVSGFDLYPFTFQAASSVAL